LPRESRLTVKKRDRSVFEKQFESSNRFGTTSPARNLTHSQGTDPIGEARHVNQNDVELFSPRLEAARRPHRSSGWFIDFAAVRFLFFF
jgi:hypothetical protein